jgi:hypothetical protein
MPAKAATLLLMASLMWAQTPWLEVKDGIVGKQLLIELKSGGQAAGKCQSTDAVSLTLISKDSTAQKIPAADINRITLERRKGPMRALLAVTFGLGAAVVAGLAGGSLREGGAGSRQVGAIYGSLAAGAAAGYIVGRKLDKKTEDILIITR